MVGAVPILAGGYGGGSSGSASRTGAGAAAARRAMTYFNPNFTSLDTNTTDFFNQTLLDIVVIQVANALHIYYTPLLIALGTIGNLVSVFVFYNSKLRLQSTSQYLSALAISDTVFLFQLLPPWMNAVQLSGLFYQNGFCQIFMYISYVSCCLSAWLVVAFTVERFVAVVYPLQRNALCTIKRARHIICSIVVTALLLNLPVLCFAIPDKYDCNIDVEYIDYAEKFNLIDTAVSFTLPMAMIIVLNASIMFGVWRLERTRRLLMKMDAPVARARPARLLACPRSQQRVTRMLLIVSSVFVILNVPAYAMRIVVYTYGMSADEITDRWMALQQLAVSFFNTNFGINFILYCLSGQNFRRALKQTIPWLRQRARRAVAVRRAATSSRPTHASSVSTSVMSNCTEATVHCTGPGQGSGTATQGPPTRRRRRDPFITRWTFDNTRHQQPTDQIEMRAINTHTNSKAIGQRR